MLYDISVVDQIGMTCFDGCLAYVNSDLKGQTGKSLDVSYKTGIENNNINANAEKKGDDKYLVTVEMVTINEIFALYSKMLGILGFYKITTLDDSTYDQKLADLMAGYLAQITIHMVIFHELGHVFNGHIDYINHKMEGTANYSLRNNLRKARPYMNEKEWQALEWNADDFSATRIVGQTLYKDNLEIHHFLKNYGHAFLLNVIATVGMYTILGMSYECTDEEKRIFKEKEHLPLRFRMKKYIETMFCAAKEFGVDIPVDKCDINAYIERLEEWFVLYMINEKKSNGDEWKITSNIEELDNEHKAYYDEVDDFYQNNLNAMLKDYSYFKVFETKAIIGFI